MGDPADDKRRRHRGGAQIINRGVTLDGRGPLCVGDRVNISAEAILFTADHDPNSPVFAGRARSTVIGDRAWIASRAVVLPGASVGDGALVAAGAVVHGLVDPWTIVAGNPARVIGNAPTTRRPNYLRPTDAYFTSWSTRAPLTSFSGRDPATNGDVSCVSRRSRNEAWVLERFLRAASTWADVIIVLDQASDYGSTEIARRFSKVQLAEYGCQSYDDPIRRGMLVDLARAAVPGPRILVALDADEFIAADSWQHQDMRDLLSARLARWDASLDQRSTRRAPRLDPPSVYGFYLCRRRIRVSRPANAWPAPPRRNAR